MNSPATYPTVLTTEDNLTNRDRMTVAFRLILAIPHFILVGGGPNSSAFNFNDRNSGDFGTIFAVGLFTGILNAAAGVVAFISWFAIMFTGRHPKGLWDFEYWVLRWQTRVGAYLALTTDIYPPFGEGEYPFQVQTEYPTVPRNRVTVFFRLFMLIPHLIVLAILGIGMFFVTVYAWFVILFTGSYPAGVYPFAVNYQRWNVRVAAYGLLLRDEYPPFSLSA